MNTLFAALCPAMAASDLIAVVKFSFCIDRAINLPPSLPFLSFRALSGAV
jgi:hypothetical protein